ncbi:hypothetical protein GmHk_09G026149 [Glycine max]|nr:hypothetical protein GmHk_09G026149 [Glycine max]
MRILKLTKYRLKAQVEKDEGPSGEGQSPQVEKDEGPKLLPGFLVEPISTYQGNPCGLYPDLSSFTGSGIIQISVACIKRSAPSQDHVMNLRVNTSGKRQEGIHYTKVYIESIKHE